MKSKSIKIFLLFIITILVLINQVSAMTIVLDPGHGGVDPGAINDTLQEKDITLKTTQFLRDYLKEYGVNIILTHEGNITSEMSVFDRAMVARDNNADLLISLHFNSGDNGASGSEIWVTQNQSLEKYNKLSTELGNKILANFQELGLPSRGVKTKICSDETDVYTDGTRADYYGIIRYAMRGTKIDYGIRTPEGKQDANIQNGEGITAILIEHCFIKTDFVYIDSDEDLKKLAEADGKAIVNQFGLTKNTPVQPEQPDQPSEPDVPSNPENPDDTEKILKSEKLKIEDGRITGIEEGTTIQEFLNSFEVAEDYEIGLETSGEVIGTGNVVVVRKKEDNSVYKQFECAVSGDLNGDGKIGMRDARLVAQHVASMGASGLTQIQIKAGDIYNVGDGLTMRDARQIAIIVATKQ